MGPIWDREKSSQDFALSLKMDMVAPWTRAKGQVFGGDMS